MRNFFYCLIVGFQTLVVYSPCNVNAADLKTECTEKKDNGACLKFGRTLENIGKKSNRVTFYAELCKRGEVFGCYLEAESLAAQGYYSDSLPIYAKACKFSKAFCNNFGAAYEHIGILSEAKIAYSQGCAEPKPDAGACTNLKRIESKFAEAAEQKRRCFEKDDLTACEKAAEVYFGSDGEDAVKMFEKACTRIPSACLNLAMLKAKGANLGEVTNLLVKACKMGGAGLDGCQALRFGGFTPAHRTYADGVSFDTDVMAKFQDLSQEKKSVSLLEFVPAIKSEKWFLAGIVGHDYGNMKAEFNKSSVKKSSGKFHLFIGFEKLKPVFYYDLSYVSVLHAYRFDENGKIIGLLSCTDGDDMIEKFSPLGDDKDGHNCVIVDDSTCAENMNLEFVMKNVANYRSMIDSFENDIKLYFDDKIMMPSYKKKFEPLLIKFKQFIRNQSTSTSKRDAANYIIRINRACAGLKIKGQDLASQ